MPRRVGGGCDVGVPWHLELFGPADAGHAALTPQQSRETVKVKLHLARLTDATTEMKALGFRRGVRVVERKFPGSAQVVPTALHDP